MPSEATVEGGLLLLELSAYQCNQVDVQSALTKCLFELRICHLRARFGENLDSFLEVCDVSVFTSCFDVLPSLSWHFVCDVLHVQHSVLFAIQGIVTLAKAVLAGALRALNSLVTLLLADTAWP